MLNENMIRTFAMTLIERNQDKFANNPRAKEYIELIQNGNSQQGEKVAMNICNAYGSSKEDAVSKAAEFFGLPK